MSRPLVRHLRSYGKTQTFDVYEVYTQPRRDRLVYRAYEAWWTFLWRSRVESLLDRVYDKRHPDVDLDEWMPPGVRNDLRLYDLSQKNVTVLCSARIEVTTPTPTA